MTKREIAALTALSILACTGQADAQNLLTNPTYADTDSDTNFGDAWGTFGNAGFLDFNTDGNPGHATFFGDFEGNSGLLFQTGVAATEGSTYRFSVAIDLEDNWNADVFLALEFYEMDDSTQVSAVETQIDIPGTIDPVSGYARVDVTAVAPTGAVFVRPVVRFDNAGLGPMDQRAAVIDNAILVEVTDETNLLRNPGFDDLLGLGNFGTLWGTFGAAGLNDFNGFTGGGDGHASLFADNVANSGGFFQTGVEGEAGQEFLFEIVGSFEFFYEADTFIGVEFFQADDNTKIGERQVLYDIPVDTFGEGYANTLRVVGRAPAGTAFVRPLVRYDNVAFTGSNQAGTFDGASMRLVTPTTPRNENPTFSDLNEDMDLGDVWLSFGAAGFNNFNGNNGGGPTDGHATLFADNTANIGSVFQLRRPGIPGEAYTFSADVNFETNWDATARLELEFYGSDDSTPLATVESILDDSITGQFRKYSVTGVAPAGTVYVRPVVSYDSVLSSGSSRAATVDNAVLTSASDNLAFNPGLEDIYLDGGFGDAWGSFGNVAFDDFFANGNPGHAIFFADAPGNSGGFFQTDIVGAGGAVYMMSVDMSFESEWDSATDTVIRLEFYGTTQDELGKIGEVQSAVVANPGAGYETFMLSALAPAGTQFVRPVVEFANAVGDTGSSEAATIDNIVVKEFDLCDFNNSGGPSDAQDVQDFLAAFNLQDPATDLAPPFGVFDFFDVSTGLDLFETCP